MAPASSECRWSRRRVLAEIALLTDLPAPKTVNFNVTADMHLVTVGLDTIDQGLQWAERLGHPATPYTNDGRRYLGHHRVTDWHGWRIQLSATEPAGDTGEPLDADTTDRLNALADDPGADAQR